MRLIGMLSGYCCMLVGKGPCPKIIMYKNKKVPLRKETAKLSVTKRPVRLKTTKRSIFKCPHRFYACIWNIDTLLMLIFTFCSHTTYIFQILLGFSIEYSHRCGFRLVMGHLNQRRLIGSGRLILSSTENIQYVVAKVRVGPSVSNTSCTSCRVSFTRHPCSPWGPPPPPPRGGL